MRSTPPKKVDSAAGSAARRDKRKDESRPCSPQAPQGWPPMDREPSCVGRDSENSPERRPLAGFAGKASTSLDVLAAVAGLGGAGRLAEHLEHVSERVERAPAVEVSPPRKRGAGGGKAKRCRGTKWTVVDSAGAFLGDVLHSASPAE